VLAREVGCGGITVNRVIGIVKENNLKPGKSDHDRYTGA